jgi:hypothetical protein
MLVGGGGETKAKKARCHGEPAGNGRYEPPATDRGRIAQGNGGRNERPKGANARAGNPARAAGFCILHLHCVCIEAREAGFASSSLTRAPHRARLFFLRYWSSGRRERAEAKRVRAQCEALGLRISRLSSLCLFFVIGHQVVANEPKRSECERSASRVDTSTVHYYLSLLVIFVIG